MLAPRTRPRLNPCRRKTLASPCHSPYGCEQLRGLARARASVAQRGEELHEREVVDEACVVATEPLQCDDADRPRADTTLASEPLERAVVGAEPVEVDRPGEPRERRARPAGEPARGDARRRESRRAPTRDGGSSPHARMIARSIWSAREAWISCPQTPRITAWVTVALRRVRIPRRRWTAGPISGSRAWSRWNSLVSSSRASMKRASSTACSHEARIDDPSVVQLRAPPPSVRRGASPATQAVPAVSRSEYGPVALSTASTIEPPYRPSADRILPRDAARRRHLAPLAPAEAPAVPRRAATRPRRPRCSTSGPTSSASARATAAGR